MPTEDIREPSSQPFVAWSFQRTGIPGGDPFLIHVDLIKARYDGRETVLVQAGDIIYLNPDNAWWMRHTFERIVPDLITIPYAAALDRWLIGRRGTN